jgi:hypothetical protein
MRKFARIRLVVLSFFAIVGLISWALERSRAASLSKELRIWVEQAVLNHSGPAGESELKLAYQSAGPAQRARIDREFVNCVMRSLQTRDNLFWKPYTVVRTNTPAFVSKWMPEWQEPRKVRRAAAWWLSYKDDPLNRAPGPQSLNRLVAPILCKLANDDPDPEVRQTAIWALGNIGIFSDESLSIMLRALEHADPADRRAAVRWFGKNRLLPQKIVPVLVRGLEDDAMRSDYAEGLRAYGPLAKFAVEPLMVLARTNDRATASVASWALEAIVRSKPTKESAFP